MDRGRRPGFFSVENIARHNQGRSFGEVLTGRTPTARQRLGRSTRQHLATGAGPVELDTDAATLTLGSGRATEVHDARAVSLRIEVGAGSRVSGARVVAFGAVGALARKRDTSYLVAEGPGLSWWAPLPARALDDAHRFVATFETWRRGDH